VVTCRRIRALAVSLVAGAAVALGGPYFARDVVDAAEKGCGGIELLDPVKRYLTRAYPNWGIVDLPDLLERDRELWMRKEGRRCPGVAAGQFKDVSQLSYAVLLTRGKGKAREELIVVLTPTSRGGVDASVASKPVQVNRAHVLRKLPGGKYQSVDGPECLETKLDVFMYESIESWALVFAWNGRRFISVTVSD
jgi:hypothetical protein